LKKKLNNLQSNEDIIITVDIPYITLLVTFTGWLLDYPFIYSFITSENNSDITNNLSLIPLRLINVSTTLNTEYRKDLIMKNEYTVCSFSLPETIFSQYTDKLAHYKQTLNFIFSTQLYFTTPTFNETAICLSNPLL